MREFNYQIKYLKGKSNIVSDAFSRKPKKSVHTSSDIIRKLLVLTKVSVSNETLNILKQQYLADNFFKNIFENVPPPYRRKGKRLYFENRLCIPEGALRQNILHDHHTSVYGGHRGYNKTNSLIKRNFFWPNMKQEIKAYTDSCRKCQESKSANRTLGEPRPFPPPEKKWEVISMDFMFKLPRTKDGYSALLVVVDKLSKRAHLIPLTTNHKSEDIAEVFYKEIYKHHGLPRKIISDRDTRFTSDFWKELAKILDIKLNLSTAFHPQTDGQSERMFRTIQEMIRCFVSHTQKDWKKYLPGLEYSYNNHLNDSTKISPFFLEYGQNPLSFPEILFTDDSVTDTEPKWFLENINKATKIARSSIQQANTRNADLQNTVPYEFEVGEKVLLSTKHLPLKTGRVKKFTSKFIGPFIITAKLADGQAYRLKLPRELNRIHSTFHISLLKPFAQPADESIEPNKISDHTKAFQSHSYGRTNVEDEHSSKTAEVVTD